ncbi:reverse transcriptase [Tanacetum coccineum]
MLAATNAVSIDASGMKKDKENMDNNNAKTKRRWSFGKSMNNPSQRVTVENYSTRMRSCMCASKKEQNNHTIAVAETVVAAADAAVAGAQAAMAVVSLTSDGRGTLFSGREKWAATKIQSVYRGHLIVSEPRARSWSIPSEDPYEEAARQLLEQAPRSPEYVPEDHVPVYIPEPEHPEDLVPAEDEAPALLSLPPSVLSTRIRPLILAAAMGEKADESCSTKSTLSFTTSPSGTHHCYL